LSIVGYGVSGVEDEVVSATDPVSVRVEDRVIASSLDDIATAFDLVVVGVDQSITATDD
jgi:hypothetical protein